MDDHDFLGNDQAVSRRLQAKAAWARRLHRQFIQACNEKPLRATYPSLNEAASIEDVGFAQGLGLAQSALLGSDVKLIVLDNRSYAEKLPKDPEQAATCLGPAQLQWLAGELVGGQRVSIVASGSTLRKGPRKGVRGSPLSDFGQELRLIERLYAAQSHQRILHIAGDLHHNCFWPVQPQLPHVREFASSGIGTGWEPFAAYTRKNFGLIEVQSSGLRVRLLGEEPDWNADEWISHEL